MRHTKAEETWAFDQHGWRDLSTPSERVVAIEEYLFRHSLPIWYDRMPRYVLHFHAAQLLAGLLRYEEALFHLHFALGEGTPEWNEYVAALQGFLQLSTPSIPSQGNPNGEIIESLRTAALCGYYDYRPFAKMILSAGND
jgi:hypothetical protein